MQRSKQTGCTSPTPDPDGSTDWADLAQQRLAAQQEQQALGQSDRRDTHLAN